MPTTCHTDMYQPAQGDVHLTFRPNHSTFAFPHNDWLMYILFYEDTQLLRQIAGSAISHLRETNANHPCVLCELEALSPDDMDCVDRLRGKVLVLLDADPAARAQLTAFRSDTIKELRPLCPQKASGFFEQLHTLILPEWIQDERRTIVDLVHAARDAYLVA